MKRSLTALLMLALLAGCQKKDEQSDPADAQAKAEAMAADVKKSTLIEVGQTVPEFSYTTLDGQTFSMTGLKDKVVWINFFATWCSGCKEEMPHLQKEVWEVYGGEKDFVLVAIAREETPEKIIPFRDERSLTLPMAPDADRSIYALFAEKYIPRNVLIDKDGKIIYESTGYDAEDFAALIEKTKAALAQ